MGGPAWYVLHSKPRKENQLNTFLQSNGIETFYPTLSVKLVNPRASKVRPYFPRYMFIHADLDVVGISLLKWSPGLDRLVEFGGQPATVQAPVIAKLKHTLATIEAAGGIRSLDLQPGDRVRIMEGPLAGYEAIFDTYLSGNERVKVLLEMLGRQVTISLDTNAIEKPHYS